MSDNSRKIEDLLGAAFKISAQLPDDQKQAMAGLLQNISDIFAQEHDAHEKTKFERDQAMDWAHRDELTGCFNRRYFDKGLRAAIQETQSGVTQHFALVMLDMDYLRKVNNALGHNAGDEVLIETSKRLQTAIGEDDILSDFGGDEFAMLIILEDGQAFDMQALQSRIQHAMDNFIVYNGAEPIPIGVSAGVVHITAKDLDNATPQAQAERLMEIADKRMYEHKETRLGRYQERAEQALAQVSVPNAGAFAGQDPFVIK
ncbi:MAG TPA: GGDEF domain-containing protein [Micavibrio sp.]|nr:GGDEF domain-containing protein [Micavibrio sp.]